jgi:hypothetical protein
MVAPFLLPFPGRRCTLAATSCYKERVHTETISFSGALISARSRRCTLAAIDRHVAMSRADPSSTFGIYVHRPDQSGTHMVSLIRVLEVQGIRPPARGIRQRQLKLVATAPDAIVTAGITSCATGPSKYAVTTAAG